MPGVNYQKQIWLTEPASFSPWKQRLGYSNDAQLVALPPLLSQHAVLSSDKMQVRPLSI